MAIGRAIAFPEEGSSEPGQPISLLEVRDLSVSFESRDGLVAAVNGVSFSAEAGQTVAIVGESGSGKSVMARAILGLHQREGYRASGEVWIDGEQIIGSQPRRLRRLRTDVMAMIFQDPLSALHPYYRIGWQIIESVHASKPGLSRREARRRALTALARVGIPDPEKRLRDYPHQLSGGMRQRVMIAIALVRHPKLLIADEPTTALDMTVQAQILDLIQDLQREHQTGVILITHDLGVAAEVADVVIVLYGGRIMEQGPTIDVLTRPQHPYTWGLLKSLTRLDRQRQRRLEPIAGFPARAGNLPAGCPFHPRCPYTAPLGTLCETDQPILRYVEANQRIACHLPDESRAELIRRDVAPWLGDSGTAGEEKRR